MTAFITITIDAVEDTFTNNQQISSFNCSQGIAGNSSHSKCSASNQSTSDSTTTTFTSISISTSTSTSTIPASSDQPQETTREEKTTIQEDDSSNQNDDSDTDSSSCDQCDDNLPANATQLELLIELQKKLSRSAKTSIGAMLRPAIKMNEDLALSGKCMFALMDLVGAASLTKAFAFKFLDATAKLPSGLMFGLLSDFGDYDECLAIKSLSMTQVESEADDAKNDTEKQYVPLYTGKYCLVDAKLDYHIELKENETVPQGIDPDGVIWDDLIKQYWTGKTSKPFQLAACIPSSCQDDDVNQIVSYVGQKYGITFKLASTCQDTAFISKQHSPDLLQICILTILYTLAVLTFVGTAIDQRLVYLKSVSSTRCHISSKDSSKILRVVLLILKCFSLSRNWSLFVSNRSSCKAQMSILGDERDNDNDDELKIPSTIREKFNSNSSISTSDFQSVKNLSNGELASTSISYNKRCVSIVDSNFDVITRKIDNNTTIDYIDKNHDDDEDYGYDDVDDNEQDVDSDDINDHTVSLNFLAGVKLLLICWITVGHSFLYPSAANYQYYRSIAKMAVTRHSLWFATINFTLAIDALIYMAGLLFVYKLLAAKYGKNQSQTCVSQTITEKHMTTDTSQPKSYSGLEFICGKILRLWPPYLCVIGLAIVLPLFGEGPMWPEMVNRRLESNCRASWWLNALFVNNLLSDESSMCLPSSWFVATLMQLFIFGSFLTATINIFSLNTCKWLTALSLILSAISSFAYANSKSIKAPIVRMDASFVMAQDDLIFSIYTSFFNSAGPFLVGMLGGFALLSYEEQLARNKINVNKFYSTYSLPTTHLANDKNQCTFTSILLAIFALLNGLTVLSSVFFNNYSPLSASIYWTLHRICWSFFVGYLIHNCATGALKQLRSLLSLSVFKPLSKLTFVAYLVHPLFIHIHTGQVRDGLHISTYNMLNIYVSRLCFTFAAALVIYLCVELPLSSLEQLMSTSLSKRFFNNTNFNNPGNKTNQLKRARKISNLRPLLAANSNPPQTIVNLNNLCYVKHQMSDSNSFSDSTTRQVETNCDIRGVVVSNSSVVEQENKLTAL